MNFNTLSHNSAYMRVMEKNYQEYLIKHGLQQGRRNLRRRQSNLPNTDPRCNDNKHLGILTQLAKIRLT